MDKEELKIEYKGYIKLNEGHNGYYLTKYSPIIFSKLINNMSVFQPIDRYDIFFDCITIFGIGRQFINLLGSIKGEDSYIIWKVLEEELKVLIKKLKGTQRLNKLKDILNELFTDSFISIGKFDVERADDVTQCAIAEVLGLFAENKVVADEAVKKYKDNIENELMNIRIKTKSLICNIACAAGSCLF